MRLLTADSPRELANAATDWIAARLADKPRSAIALPTGKTPLGLYAELVARYRSNRISCEYARVFNLDEYCGLAQSNPRSYADFLRRHLLDPLKLRPDQVRLLQGDAPDPLAECCAYDAAIAACGGIDLCILGLGANGHIAFNEPYTDWSLRTHVVRLADTTRSSEAMPFHGITMGIRTILEAQHILLLIAGNDKQAARDALHHGVANPQWPVTSLLGHRELTTIELS